ncbi:hypothetical protein ABPG75_003792 [Micractinium tetrahymenae]
MSEVAEGTGGGARPGQEQGEPAASKKIEAPYGHGPAWVEMGTAPLGSGGGPHGEGKGAHGGSSWTASTPWHMRVEDQGIAKGGGGSGAEYHEQGKDMPTKSEEP